MASEHDVRSRFMHASTGQHVRAGHARALAGNQPSAEFRLADELVACREVEHRLRSAECQISRRRYYSPQVFAYLNTEQERAGGVEHEPGAGGHIDARDFDAARAELPD